METNLVDELGSGYASGATESEGQSMKLRKIIRWIVYAAAFFVPLWFLPITADVLDFNKEVLLLVLAGVGLILFLIDMIKSGLLKITPSAFYWPLAGISLAGVISVIFSVNRFASLFGNGNDRSFSLISLLSLSVLFFLALNVIEDKGKYLTGVLVTSLGLAYFYGALQILNIHIFPGSVVGKAAFNTIGSLNAIGVLAAATLPLFFIKHHLESMWQQRVVSVVRIVGLLSALFLMVVINWWMVWVVAFVTILAYIAFTASSSEGQGKMKFFALPMAIIIIGIFLWIINFNWATIKSKLPVEIAPTHATSYGISWRAIKNRPLGYGLENYLIGYDKFRPLESVNNILFQARFTDASSEFATMAVEGGIPMILAFLAFLFFYVRASIKLIKNKFGGDPTLGKIWAGTLGVILIFFFYPVSFSMLLVLLGLLAAASLSSINTGEQRVLNLEGKGTYSFIGSVAFIIGLVLVLVGGYFISNEYVGNVKLANAMAETDRSQAINGFVSSINSFSKDSRPYRLLTQSLLLQIADDLKNGPKDADRAVYAQQLQNRITSSINVAVRATEVNPSDSENWLNRGFVYQNLVNLVNGADEAAINMYKETLDRSPANALAYVRVGNLYLSLADNAKKGTPQDVINGNLDKAEENYKKAISLYNNYGQALYNLAAVYDRKGKLNEAIAQFDKLRAANPRDPSLLFQLGLLQYRNNNHDAALSAWEQAVLSFPDYSNARWYLSLIYEERGDLKRALDEVKAIEKVNPDNALVEDRLKKLEEGIKTIIPPETVLDQTPLNNEK